MTRQDVKLDVGANIMYCGHAGYFVADILYMGPVAVVSASGPVTPGNIHRHGELGSATHQLMDFPMGGYWKPERGVFVVPAEQVTIIDPIR